MAGPAIPVRTDFPRTVREIENTWIPMTDGTRLAARIWLPEDAEDDPVPAILEYLPYRKRDGTVERDHLTHPYFAGHGYAGIRVDMRGTGDSEGVCLGEYLLQEQDDAMAIIAWLVDQPWCSGKVGMIGISWGGFNGLQIAARRPAGLGAVITLCSTDDRYADDIHFMGGAVLTDKLSWGATAFGIANTPPDPDIVGARWRDMWLERLENNGLWLLDWFRHQRRDAFYAHGSVCESYADIEVPVYAVGGWADGYTNAIMRMLDHLPGPRKGLIGPWAHKYPHFALPGPRIGFLQECLRWWDQHLKGLETGIMDEPMLRAWVQEPAAPATYREAWPGRWVAEPDWSGKAIDTWTLYPDAHVLGPTPGKEIQLSSPETTGHAAPAWCCYGLVPDGPLDQSTEDGMTVFETAPLDADMDLLGFPMFHAEAQADRMQANVAATLSAVDAAGRVTLISFGVLNLTHRDGHADPAPMPDRRPVPISIQLNACGQRIAAGQRLRLSLSTAYWPIIFPSQSKASVVLAAGTARIDLPVRAARDLDSQLTPFGPAEAAAPVDMDVLVPGSNSRTRSTDYATGLQTYTRFTDSGRVRYRHIGMETQDVNRDVFVIHPDDPNSAVATCAWTKRYAREGWQADVDVSITVRALAAHWQIEATLKARDGDGPVAEKTWSETVPRDLV